MPRFVALLLALLLPLQLTWGAAAALCQHEADPQATQHVGHHGHVHKGDAKKAAAGSGLVTDNDCGYCQATGAAAVAEVAPSAASPAVDADVAVLTEQTHASALARAPDRPQWPRLA